MHILEELESRNLLAQLTFKDELIEHLKQPQTVYAGFDPTASSLHVGHLLPILNLKRFVDCGHHVIVLIGGATAKIGDPSGKTQMRKMLSKEELAQNIKNISLQIKNILQCTEKQLTVLNNSEWLDGVNYLEFLAQFGVHFNINKMIAAECYKSRLNEGLTFLEFNYMVLQSFDFYYLYKNHNCTIQIGGDDQWSNMLGGVSLIRKFDKYKSFCITSPLLTTANGKKMGKTESGAVWLDSTMTSCFDFFQFWRNIEDQSVFKCLDFYTLLSKEEINSLKAHNLENINLVKEKLAFEMTKIVHGDFEAQKSLDMARSLFSKEKASENAPVVYVSSENIQNSIDIISLLSLTKIVKSKGEARRLIEQKGISVNGEKVHAFDLTFSFDDFNKDNGVFIKKGKKFFYQIKIR